MTARQLSALITELNTARTVLATAPQINLNGTLTIVLTKNQVNAMVNLLGEKLERLEELIPDTKISF